MSLQKDDEVKQGEHVFTENDECEARRGGQQKHAGVAVAVAMHAGERARCCCWPPC